MVTAATVIAITEQMVFLWEYPVSKYPVWHQELRMAVQHPMTQPQGP